MVLGVIIIAIALACLASESIVDKITGRWGGQCRLGGVAAGEKSSRVILTGRARPNEVLEPRHPSF